MFQNWRNNVSIALKQNETTLLADYIPNIIEKKFDFCRQMFTFAICKRIALCLHA